ncbi:hypothetical protein EYD10_01725 [Varanus komodoensis]|nr:hypothetical protein EYD10_01725 [Varanus komodoensis]
MELIEDWGYVRITPSPRQHPGSSVLHHLKYPDRLQGQPHAERVTVVQAGSYQGDYITSLLNESAWVGLSDENVEGTWEWADGSRLISQYWSPGNPTPSEDYGEMEQDCAFIDPASGRRNWKDAACHELKGWVCKEGLRAKKA